MFTSPFKGMSVDDTQIKDTRIDNVQGPESKRAFSVSHDDIAIEIDRVGEIEWRATESGPSGKDLDQPSRVFRSEGILPVPRTLNDGMRDDVVARRSECMIRLRAVGNQVEQSTGEERDIDDGKVVRSQGVPCWSAIGDDNVGRDLEDN